MSTITYMGRQLEIPDTIDQNVREMTELADLYAAGLAAERREAEVREARDRVMHHMWLPSDNESNSNELSADTLENCGVTAIADTGLESSWNLSLSVNDIIDDKYKEMEKRVEEQDKTIADLKSIIENLQDIVYQQKLDKEAKNLVL